MLPRVSIRAAAASVVVAAVAAAVAAADVERPEKRGSLLSLACIFSSRSLCCESALRYV